MMNMYKGPRDEMLAYHCTSVGLGLFPAVDARSALGQRNAFAAF